MTMPVLERVDRRRRYRRRRRRWPLVLVTIVLLAGAALAGWRLWPSAGEPAQAAKGAAARPVVAVRPVRQRARVVRAPVAPLLLAPRGPLRRVPALAPSSGSAILVDASTGKVLWAKRPHTRRLIASTTKIMTAVLALERLRPDELITIAPSVPRVAPFREGLRAGERVEAWKLLYGLLLYSGNDDALALAIGTAGTRAAFLRLMNEKARRLGLRDSHFTTPSGLIDEGNYSSVWDMAALTRYALQDPRFRTIVRTKVKRVPWAAPTYAKIFVNKNHLIGSYPGADGVKTGWTTLAGHCLVASAHRDGIRLIAVVLGSRDPLGDAKRLLDYGFRTRG